MVRGGVGVFTGRPPFGLWLNAFSNYGKGVVELDCDVDGAGPPPAFDPSYAHPPQMCANGQTITDAGTSTVFLLDRALSYPRSLRRRSCLARTMPSRTESTASRWEGLAAR